MVRKIFFILLFSFSGALFAQQTTPAAAPIINKIVQKYSALSAFSLDFTMNIEADSKKIRSFTGVLFVKKEKYYLSFEDQIMANDGVTMWNYQKNTKEVTLFEAEDDELMIFHPLKMLNNWDKEYNAKFIREEELQKNSVTILDLTPKKQSQFYKIRLFIDKATSYIQQVMMYELDGTTLTYLVTKFKPNAVVEDNKFTFNKKDYPDVQVNDMR
ncbi:MAG: outer membrane lipoprotein carrier protein LolA [Bacteroidetes bacterium]|nr:outer membrane lipoprotein carrier protein LolA [Bacteroidota bacterium]MCL1969290.1 outer membrane lipoprotein carrier protein LolA [Bacteroidota bacterium]